MDFLRIRTLKGLLNLEETDRWIGQFMRMDDLRIATCTWKEKFFNCRRKGRLRQGGKRFEKFVTGELSSGLTGTNWPSA